MDFIAVKTYLFLGCAVICIQLTSQAVHGTVIITTDNFNSTGKVDSSRPGEIGLGEKATESLSNVDKKIQVTSNELGRDDEDLLDVDVVGSDDDSPSLPTTHRQKRTFWPFTSLFGYDYDYGYMPPPPPMFGRPGFPRPGFGGMMGGWGMGPMRPPPPPMLGLGFSVGF